MHRVRSLTRRHPARAALLAVLLATLTGCGSGLGEVSGTVRYNGKPLPFGTIQFLGQDGIPYAGQIQPGGTFTALVPVGEAKVIVSCIDEARLSRRNGQASHSGRAAALPLSPGNISLLPARYADGNASRLTVVVKPGKTTQYFALTSP
jgi:hypothetical protein